MNTKAFMIKTIAFSAALSMTTGAFAAKAAKDAKKSKSKRDVSMTVYSKYQSPTTSGLMTDWNALNCHDPKLFQDDDGTYYVYSTDASIGGAGKKGLQIRRSADLVNWECLDTSALAKNWDKKWLKWVEFDRASASTWAPTVKKHNGLYYLFHGIITDKDNAGDPVSAIAMTVASSPLGPFYPVQQAASKDPKIKEVFDKLGIKYSQSVVVRYTYNDRSYVSDDNDIVEYPMYNTANYDTYNGTEADFAGWTYGFGCIDPEFVMDVSTGEYMKYKINGKTCLAMTYGSWKGGIALIYLDELTLKPVDQNGEPLDMPCDAVEGAFGKLIAGGFGAAYEGAQVIYNSQNDWYYCFVSMGALDFDYRVGVGRSKNIEGPYLDASGKCMTMGPLSGAGEFHTIGSKIIGSEELKGEYSFRSQGGQSILRTQDGKVMFACHARTNFLPGYFFFLQLHQMFFTKEGWPVINGNEYYNDYDGKDEALAAIAKEDIAGTYDLILTERSDKMGDVTFNSAPAPVTCYITDALPTKSKECALNEDGTISGELSGSWTLADDGYTVSIKLDNIGTFDGYIMAATDWARYKGATRKTISINTIDSTTTGEYLWGNKRQ